MEKLIKNGKVGVLISPGFGAGWSTWNEEGIREVLAMDKNLVQLVLEGKLEEVEKVVKGMFPEEDIYCGGVEDLTVWWVEKGEQFEIEEYDGSEEIHIIGGRSYMTA